MAVNRSRLPASGARYLVGLVVVRVGEGTGTLPQDRRRARRAASGAIRGHDPERSAIVAVRRRRDVVANAGAEQSLRRQNLDGERTSALDGDDAAVPPP